ncbi:MAG: glutamate racemase [Termitinemataceae bacterium]|nr:MAG: glutamate racemase [Termitinemataceae bacterium]
MKFRQADSDIQLVFLDSGIGGIPYLQHFMERNKNPLCRAAHYFSCHGELHSVFSTTCNAAESRTRNALRAEGIKPCSLNKNIRVAYIADNKNFPYGSKTKEELLVILTVLVKKIIQQFNAKIIVLACNTASVSALNELRNTFFDIEFVGTVPALRPAITACKSGTIGLLGTERTVEDAYIQTLAHNTNPLIKLIAVAAPDIVDFVELQLDGADENTKMQLPQKYIEIFREKNADGIVLGCTHFLFLAQQFRNTAGSDIKIFDSIEGVCARVETLIDARLQYANCIEENAQTAKNIFAITKNANINKWQKRAADLDMDFVVIE